MPKKAIIIIAVLVVVIVVGFGVGYFLLKKNAANPPEPIDAERFSYTTEDMYCNVKNSKKIVKLKISVETIDEEEVKKLEAKSYLIKDIANKSIRNSEEKDLEGQEGHVRLQEIIKEQLLEAFKSETISNVYFDEFVIQ